MITRYPDRVVVINDRSTKVGGASNLAILSAHLLKRAGIPVTYLAGDAAGSELPADDTINLGGAPLTDQGRIAALISGLYNTQALEAVREVIDSADTASTIYHVHGWSKILSPSIFQALWPVRQRVVLHAHDYFLCCPNGGFANYRKDTVCLLTPMSVPCMTTQCDKRGYHEKIWRSARHVLRERLYPTSELPANIVIVHQRMREYFERSGICTDHIETIRNPVEPFLRRGAEPWTMRDFFFVGRLEPEKGFEDAARAARLANVRLQIIGDGAGRSLLERDYPEVIIHGWKVKGEMHELLHNARAIVVSSRVPEPFALAAVEAIGSGIPVIVPDAALLGNELEEFGCALTFRTGNIGSLATAMRQLAADDAMVRSMSLNGLIKASSLAHSPETWGEALIALYGRILERTSLAGVAGRLPERFGNRSAAHRRPFI
ncbi:glycosyltransferase family 4 protein [Rhizobium sullae]|uniref:Glycosyltransferase involved in cell wall biosynthesis n=1 Tax=Rhizobium sullae TaxID=50338 RepID=A0A4V2V8R4_RHISU|nr:glycosyltransferase family 4 protein [Rhizobium sullae]TCU14295.1 glycosyltransferase involved in cell wall biosynthesis [Rhizobium sullae]